MSNTEKHNHVEVSEYESVLTWDSRCDDCLKERKHSIRPILNKGIPLFKQNISMNTETNKVEKSSLEDVGYYIAMQGLLDIAEGGRRIEEWNIVMSEADHILHSFISEQIKLAEEKERELQTKLREIAINNLITDTNTTRKEGYNIAIDEFRNRHPKHLSEAGGYCLMCACIDALKDSILNLKKK